MVPRVVYPGGDCEPFEDDPVSRNLGGASFNPSLRNPGGCTAPEGAVARALLQATCAAVGIRLEGGGEEVAAAKEAAPRTTRGKIIFSEAEFFQKLGTMALAHSLKRMEMLQNGEGDKFMTPLIAQLLYIQKFLAKMSLAFERAAIADREPS
jgi:hypothetical protein